MITAGRRTKQEVNICHLTIYRLRFLMIFISLVLFLSALFLSFHSSGGFFSCSVFDRTVDRGCGGITGKDSAAFPPFLRGGSPGDLIYKEDKTGNSVFIKVKSADSNRKNRKPGVPESRELSRQLLEKLDCPLILAEVSPEERDLVVFLFENAYPDRAEKLCEFLSSVSSPEDVKNIKYTVYTAPAAWRDAFLCALGNLMLLSISGRDCYIGGFRKKVCVDMRSAASDPRGPYTSFFHECAHGICDVLYSGTLNTDALTMQLALETAAFASGGGNTSCSAAEETVSDMFSAFFTSGSFRFPQSCSSSELTPDSKTAGYFHEPSYWKTPDLPAKEFFAEYFSYMICRSQKALDCLEGNCGIYPLSSRMVTETVCGIRIAGL